MDELLDQFLIEGRDLVAEANAALRAMADTPGNAGALDSAFRAVHTLKGSVGLFDMASAERTLHHAETMLSDARKSGGLDARAIAQLIAIIDQVDRWIDALERDGNLGAQADTVADALTLDHRTSGSLASSAEQTPQERGSPAWVTALLARQRATVALIEAPLVAFRYTPDDDAFFRGEDPLALVAGLPGVVALDILPAGGAWPSRDAFEPFACVLVIEGISTATEEVLRPSFRMVPDQFCLLPLERDAPLSAETNETGSLDFTPAATTVLRVEVHRVDTLADTIGELVVATNGLATLAERADSIDPALALSIRSTHAEFERAVGATSRAVSAVRLVSLAPALRRLPRLVREIASGVDKSVNFTMVGDQTEVDKQIADGLFEPLLHLVRNAIDHGIEAAATRAAAGKAPDGKLTLTIGREADDITVMLADDGAGIDRDRIKASAVAKGLITPDVAETLSDTATLSLIFTAGFSTAAAVTGLSGRGVGMDAVQAAVERLRGRIEIDSVVGKGTCFTLRLPANAITTRLLVIEVASDRYAVPFDQIAETVRVNGNRLIPLGTGTACVLRDRTVPVLSLAELLGNVERGTLPAKLLVTRASGEAIALRVDGFHERINAMVRPPSGLLAGVPLVGGTTVMDDGAVMLVLNMAELVA